MNIHIDETSMFLRVHFSPYEKGYHYWRNGFIPSAPGTEHFFTIIPFTLFFHGAFCLLDMSNSLFTLFP